jgi:hypothetical protein
MHRAIRMIRSGNIERALNFYYLSCCVVSSLKSWSIARFAEFVNALLERSELELAKKVVVNAIKNIR